MTPNLDALAKLAPFHTNGEEVWPTGCGFAPLMCTEMASALNEWAELRGAVADLRAWRSEHDCRYTLGAVADVDGVHCPIDNPCVRCQRRMDWDAAQKENAELRAYRERTEGALARICRQAGNSPTDYEFLTPDDLRDAGLWREPGQGATDGN